MAQSFPTLDELRRRRATVHATVGRRLVPRIVAGSLAQLVLVGVVVVNRDALVERGALAPALLFVLAMSTVAAVWLIMSWRPRLLATLAAEDALLCHRCGTPLLVAGTRQRAGVVLTGGGPTSQHYLREGHCVECGAPVVAELQDSATGTPVPAEAPRQPTRNSSSARE